jgi:hypothetical protein
MSGSWTQKGWNRFGWWPLWLGKENILAEGLHDWGRWTVPFFNQTLAFALHWGKARKTSVRVAEMLETTRCADLAVEHQSSLVTHGWLQSALGRHKCLPSCRTRGFPASDNFNLKLSVSALMWSAKNGIPKSSWICLLPTYQEELVAMRRHLDCNTCGPPYMAASSGPPDRTYIIHHRTDELLVKQHAVSDEQAVSPVQEGAKHAQSLSCLLSYLVDVCRAGKLCTKGQPFVYFLEDPSE